MTPADIISEAARRTAAILGTRIWYAEPEGERYRSGGTWSSVGHGPMGAVRGVLWHDTVTGPGWSTKALASLLSRGYAKLPGPIANVGLDRDGTLVLVAGGRAYHAGSGSWQGVTNGNYHLVGLEVANSGRGSGEKWTPIQVRVARVFTAEVLKLAGLTPRTVCGHLEWAPSRKVDPWSLDMVDERRQVAALMTATPAPTGDEEDEVDYDKLRAIVADEAAKAAEAALDARLGGRSVEQDLRTIRLGIRDLGAAAGVETQHTPLGRILA